MESGKFLVVLIVDDPDDCGEILKAWEEIGVGGVTIVESTGLGRVKRSWQRDDLPLMPSLREIFQRDEIRHRTVFSVVDDEKMVDSLISATEKITGALDDENTGFLFVVPVLRAVGLRPG
jgi:nitrogen regulatory protein P-II 1